MYGVSSCEEQPVTMQWLDDAAQAVRVTREDARLIVEQQETIYESLWNELKTHIAAAKGQFPELGTNEEPLSTVINLPADGSGRQVVVSLSKEDHVIEASGTGVHLDIKLRIAVCDGGVACLKFDGAPISDKDAAIAILRPLLFPELYPAVEAPGVY
jgi:hypothetical protein